MSDFNAADWQNFIYLSLLLIVLILGNLFKSNLGFKRIIKYLLIWSGTALIAVSLYAYRYEFSDFKNRILRELNPSAAQITESKTIVINVSQDGHFYVNLRINSIPVRFMVDTGASDIAINLRDAIKLGFDLKTLSFTKMYQTANGTSFGAGINLKEIEIGDITFNDLEASVNDGEMGTSLLGMGFLKRFRKYEFYQDRLELSL